MTHPPLPFVSLIIPFSMLQSYDNGMTTPLHSLDGTDGENIEQESRESREDTQEKNRKGLYLKGDKKHRPLLSQKPVSLFFTLNRTLRSLWFSCSFLVSLIRAPDWNHKKPALAPVPPWPQSGNAHRHGSSIQFPQHHKAV